MMDWGSCWLSPQPDNRPSNNTQLISNAANRFIFIDIPPIWSHIVFLIGWTGPCLQKFPPHAHSFFYHIIFFRIHHRFNSKVFLRLQQGWRICTNNDGRLWSCSPMIMTNEQRRRSGNGFPMGLLVRHLTSGKNTLK